MLCAGQELGVEGDHGAGHLGVPGVVGVDLVDGEPVLVTVDRSGQGVGIGIGLLLTVATSLVLPSAVPFRLSGLLDLLIAAAFVLVSVIGGLISVRVVSRIDPVEAIS